MFKKFFIFLALFLFLFSFPYKAIGEELLFTNFSDNTTALQEQIDALPLNGILDGDNKTYIVTSLILKSDITIKNFYFITKGGNTDFVSPITVGSVYSTEVISNVTIFNVHIYGNRANQTSIGASEDGGRHGFRILGHVNNLLIENCSANYCASDGLCIYSGLGGEDFPKATNITIKNCSFNWNRRHGCSGDSIKGASFINVEFNDNGQNLNNTSPLNDGNRGANFQGNFYGNGIDMEGYGIDSTNSNIVFSNISALRNMRAGILFYGVSVPTDLGFVISNYIYIFNSIIDNGTGFNFSKQPYAIEFTSAYINKNLGPIFSNIFLFNNIIYGELSFRAVDKVIISGGEIINNNFSFGNLDYATNIFIFNQPNNAINNFQINFSTFYNLSNYKINLFGYRFYIRKP